MRGEVTNRVLLGRKRHGRPGIHAGCQRWERPGWQQTRRPEDHRMTAAAKSTPVLKSLNGFWGNSRPEGTGNVARSKGLPARQSLTLLTRGAYGNLSYGKG